MDRTKYTNEQNIELDLIFFGVAYTDKITGSRIDPIKIRKNESDNSYVILNDDNSITPINVDVIKA